MPEHGGLPAAGWRGSGVALVGTLVLILLLYRDTTVYLAASWSRFQDGPYGHGFLVLFVVIYLIYRRRDRLRALVPFPAVRALPAVAVCVLVWLAASLADVQMLQAIVLLPLILAVTWAMAGAAVTRLLLLPVLFTVFALPVWSPLLPLLRAMTSAGAFFLVRLSGITAYLKDYEVQLPYGQLSIEAACSGLNYLLAALTLGVFYAWLNYGNYRSRLLVIGAAAGAALLANILRVFIIVYLAYVTEMQHPLVRDHLMLGWYLFGALVLVLLFIDHLVYRRRAPAPEIAPASITVAGRVVGGRGRLRRNLVQAAVLGLIVSGPAAAWWFRQPVAAFPPAALRLPPGQAGWSGPVSVNDDWLPVYHGASQLRGGYYKHGMQVLLYIGYYPRQRQDSELVNELNSISGGPTWQLSGRQSPVVSREGQRYLETDLAAADGRHRLVWYRYRVAGHYTVSEYMAKALQVAGLAAGRQEASVIALASDSGEDQARVRSALEEFLTAMEPALRRIVDGQPRVQGNDR